MTTKIPRRRFDASGQPIVEWPEQDPAEQRRHDIGYWRGILNATLPDGSPSYTAEARALAERSLQALLEAGA